LGNEVIAPLILWPRH